jgi:hypothetical protein
MRPNLRAVLALAIPVTLVARGTLFSDGGTVGAWASSIIFWVGLGVYMILSFYEDVIKRTSGRGAMVVRWFLLALCVLCIVPFGVEGRSWLTDLARTYFLGGLLSVVGISIYDWRKRRRTASESAAAL